MHCVQVSRGTLHESAAASRASEAKHCTYFGKGLQQALEHAGLTWETPDSQLDPARCGILIGTAMGGMHTFSTAVEDLTQRVRALPGSQVRDYPLWSWTER